MGIVAIWVKLHGLEGEVSQFGPTYMAGREFVNEVCEVDQACKGNCRNVDQVTWPRRGVVTIWAKLHGLEGELSQFGPSYMACQGNLSMNCVKLTRSVRGIVAI